MAAFPLLLLAGGLASLGYGLFRPKRVSYQDVVDGKATTDEYNEQAFKDVLDFNGKWTPQPPPPPPKEYPHNVPPTANLPAGTLILQDTEIIADLSGSWSDGPVGVDRTIPVAWRNAQYQGSNPMAVVWISSDRSACVVAWNAGTPPIQGMNLTQISDNQMVLAKAGRNALSDKVIEWWDRS